MDEVIFPEISSRRELSLIHIFYRVADVDENDVYTATKQFDELAKSISDISSKTTADDWETVSYTHLDWHYLVLNIMLPQVINLWQL